MVKSIVFDLDGLLIDSETLWHQTRINFFRSFGLSWELSDQQNTMGKSTVEWSAYMAARIGKMISREKVAYEIIKEMQICYSKKVPVLPGAEKTINELSGYYPLAIASGSPINLICQVLSVAGWERYFSEIVSGDDMKNGKPDPEIYFSVADKLQVSTSEMVVFEDSSSGILSAYRAGAKIIAVPNSHISPPKEILDLADITLKTLEVFSKDSLLAW